MQLVMPVLITLLQGEDHSDRRSGLRLLGVLLGLGRQSLERPYL